VALSQTAVSRIRRAFGLQPHRQDTWVLPNLPGTPARASHDYVRAGTSSLYAARNLSTGKVIGSPHARHRAIAFKKFLTTLDREVPADQTVAGRPPAIRPALHPDQLLRAEPGRALVRRTGHQQTPTRRPPLSA
jgi:hypothetical protein